jgi:hypothetical protein
MKRIEIIFSQAVEDDLTLLLNTKNIKKYTIIQNVMGQGESIPKMGDEVWPQLNTMFIIYCSDDESEIIKTALTDLRNAYPQERIADFISEANEF